MTFISKIVKLQFINPTVLNLYIVLETYERISGVHMHNFTWAQSFVYVDMHIGYKTHWLYINTVRSKLYIQIPNGKEKTDHMYLGISWIELIIFPDANRSHVPSYIW